MIFHSSARVVKEQYTENQWLVGVVDSETVIFKIETTTTVSEPFPTCPLLLFLELQPPQWLLACSSTAENANDKH